MFKKGPGEMEFYSIIYKNRITHKYEKLSFTMIIEKYAVCTNNDPTVWPLQHRRVSMSVNKRFHFKKETDPRAL